MTFDESRLTVFAMTAPQPSRNARVITLRFVPGGPDPMTNGFGSFRPSTVVASVGITLLLLVNLVVYRFRRRNSTRFFEAARWIARSTARCVSWRLRRDFLSSSGPAAAGLDPPDRLVGQLVETGHGQFKMLFFGVFDFVVADAV